MNESTLKRGNELKQYMSKLEKALGYLEKYNIYIDVEVGSNFRLDTASTTVLNTCKLLVVDDLKRQLENARVEFDRL